jgi:hypothetical protein
LTTLSNSEIIYDTYHHMTQPQLQQSDSHLKQKQKATTNQALNAKGDNLYAVAYKKVWDQLPPWRKSELTEMIAAKDFNNRHYTDFIKVVISVAEES